MTMFAGVEVNELEEMVTEAINNKKNMTSLLEITSILEPIIERFFKFSLENVTKNYIEHYSKQPPIIILDSQLRDSSGCYEPISKRIHVGSWSYQNFIFAMIRDDYTANRITSILKSRMLFTITHEIGHYHYFLDNKPNPFTVHEILSKSNEEYREMSFEEISQSEKIKEAILSEAAMHIHMEKDADEFAFKWIEKFNPEDYQILREESHQEKRIECYVKYAYRIIKQTISVGLNHLPFTEKKELITQYEDLFLEF